MYRFPMLCLLLVALARCSAPQAGLHAVEAPRSGAGPEDRLDPAHLEADLRFLASDALMGRDTGSPGSAAAARYIAEQFRAAGVRPAPGTENYLQAVPFLRTASPRSGHLVLRGDTLRQGQDLLILEGPALETTGPFVYAGYGLEADYAGLDAAGKIVMARAGRPDDRNVQQAFAARADKRRLAEQHGAVALVELYDGAFPWTNLVNYLGGARFGLDERAGGEAAAIPHAWIEAAAATPADTLAAAPEGTATFVSPGLTESEVVGHNVAGLIQGSDPALRDEYVVLMAHYDHVGAGLSNGPGATPADSIFNGARDNAMGTVAVIGAARALAARPPARSILLLAVTGEEKGLLGSRYYVNHPLVPLDQTMFVLNIDNAGYTDTTIVTLVGLGRTTADEAIRAGAAAAGLALTPDPAPEQNLFDRSDNVNFARKGVPAPTFTGGFRSFTDPAIARYYHRPEDEVDDFDFDYLTRFVRAYAQAARNVAGMPERPRWVEGDTYEEAARELYGAY